MTPTERIRHKKYLQMQYQDHKSQILIHFSLFYDQPRCCTFQDSPLTPMLKFQSATKIMADRQNIYNFTFPYDCLSYTQVWLRSDQNCWRSSVLKFSAPYGPVLTKISKQHKSFKFWQIAKTSNSLYSLMTTILTIQFS